MFKKSGIKVWRMKRKKTDFDKVNARDDGFDLFDDLSLRSGIEFLQCYSKDSLFLWFFLRGGWWMNTAKKISYRQLTSTGAVSSAAVVCAATGAAGPVGIAISWIFSRV
jgi:hypothetical protein